MAVRVSVAVMFSISLIWLSAQRLSPSENDVKRSTISVILWGVETSGTRWLSAEEQETWRAFVGTCHAFFADIDAQLQRDSGMPLAYYEILVRLSEAPDHTLRMSRLADAAASSRSAGPCSTRSRPSRYGSCTRSPARSWPPSATRRRARTAMTAPARRRRRSPRPGPPAAEPARP